MEQFTVAGASIETEDPLPPLSARGFDHARAFQNRAVEWIHDGESPVAVLRAPTGAGKTATFFELIADREMTLLVYPTNALLRQQRKRFNENGVEAAILNGATLEGHAQERIEDLLRYVNKYTADHDVVLTNPDILQAILQDLYRGGEPMRFFDLFDSIVYDEFHFYGAMAASGLLLQIKIISERHADPRILLASATPNENFVEFLEEEAGLAVRGIEASYTDDGDQFRHPVTVHRHSNDRILDRKDQIASELEGIVKQAGEYNNPGAVVVFNRAKDSNEFHDFLHEEHEEVFEHTAKDNGFDTEDESVDLDEAEFYILNTTSKGEVGLDYDIRTMYMEAPFEASAFLQRFGRAGRQSEADVHVFSLGKGPWGNDVDFPTFASVVYDGLEAPEMDRTLLSDLVGLRAALAIADREDRSRWFNQELRADFEENVNRFGQWRGFIREVDREHGEIKEGFEPGKYHSDSPEANLLTFVRECFAAFRGLRGQSLPASIKYPRGDRLGLTTYDLTSALRYYDIERVENEDVLVVEPADDGMLSTVTARLPAYETQPTQYDRPMWRIEKELQTKIRRHIDQVGLDSEFAVDTGLLHRFFDLFRIVDAVVPSRITTAEYEIEVTTSGSGPPELSVHERDL